METYIFRRILKKGEFVLLYFEVIASRCSVEEEGAYIAYGIDVFEVKNGKYRLIERIDDITQDPDVMLRFAEDCNEGQPALSHLPDLVEDLLSAP